MRPRASKDLSQLADPALFNEVAEGLQLIVENARRLNACTAALVQANHFQGGLIMEALCEEEAAKYLILVDAIRCPRQPANRFAAQLSRFNDHLAKGLYSRACSMSPTTLGELQGYLDHEREEFYLDGPNDVDWIFRNEIAQNREGLLYVDYVAHTHDHSHSWAHPGIWNDEVFGYLRDNPPALRMASTLNDVGFSNADALATVADFWRSHQIDPEMPWNELRNLNRQTLERLHAKNLLLKYDGHEYGDVINRWQFPMYALDLSLRKVDIDKLRERRDRWSPDWTY